MFLLKYEWKALSRSLILDKTSTVTQGSVLCLVPILSTGAIVFTILRNTVLKLPQATGTLSLSKTGL